MFNVIYVSPEHQKPTKGTNFNTPFETIYNEPSKCQSKYIKILCTHFITPRLQGNLTNDILRLTQRWPLKKKTFCFDNY